MTLANKSSAPPRPRPQLHLPSAGRKVLHSIISQNGKKISPHSPHIVQQCSMQLALIRSMQLMLIAPSRVDSPPLPTCPAMPGAHSPIRQQPEASLCPKPAALCGTQYAAPGEPQPGAQRLTVSCVAPKCSQRRCGPRDMAMLRAAGPGPGATLRAAAAQHDGLLPLQHCERRRSGGQLGAAGCSRLGGVGAATSSRRGLRPGWRCGLQTA